MRSVSGKSMNVPRAHWRGKNQFGETLAAHQPLGAVVFGADKFSAGTGRFGLGVAGHVEPGRVFGDLGTDLAFEAWPAVHEKRVH